MHLATIGTIIRKRGWGFQSESGKFPVPARDPPTMWMVCKTWDLVIISTKSISRGIRWCSLLALLSEKLFYINRKA